MALSVHPLGAHTATPPIEIPAGHIGPVMLPGTNRTVWWTGRVAIGLRYEQRAEPASLSQSAAWIQDVLLGSGYTRHNTHHPHGTAAALQR